MNSVRAARSVLAFVLLALGLQGAGYAISPWIAIEDLRRSLVAESPLEANFVQTYVPMGFSTGEEEEGRLAVFLPQCLRWDYATPYPKSFLLCGETVHSWNPGEAKGRLYHVDATQEPGLDFLLLSTDELQLRYNAASREHKGGTLVITLEPTRPSEEVAQATVILDPSRKRLLSLSFRDGEGNLTRFEISNYLGPAPVDIFSAPDGIEWEEE